jgi:hypothetical protein
LSKAQSNPAFNGIRSCEVCKTDEFTIDIANGKITHTFSNKDKREEIVGAYAIAFRKGGEPTVEYANIKDYDKGQFTWKTHKAAMIKKVAETNALKKGFGISGVNSEYDFDVKDNIVMPIEPTKADIEIKNKELIDTISNLKEVALKEMYRIDCRKAKESGKYDLAFIESKLLEVKGNSK